MAIDESYARIVEIIQSHRYIALETLSRLLRPEIFDGVKHPKAARVTKTFMAEIKDLLDKSCSIPTASVGKLDQKDARDHWLLEDVYYSTEWMIRQMEVNESLTVAGLVGLSLYEELQEFTESQYKETGKIRSALIYRGAHDWLGKKNHQKIIGYDDFHYFLSAFMRIKPPYAFRLAKELEKNQEIQERQRRRMVTPIYEYLAQSFAYEPARNKLVMR